MRQFLTIAAIALNALLMGCAAPLVQSDVTVFQDWPADLHDASFTFDRTPDQAKDLEYRTYENLVRDELVRLGLVEAASPASTKLKVALAYGMNVRDVRMVEPVVLDQFGPPYYGPGWRQRHGRLYSPFYRAYYDPLWFGAPVVEYREDQFELFTRQLKVTIARAADAAKVYDVTVDSEGRKGALASVMPYMVKSAFLGFPGKNGESRHVALPVKG